VKAEAILGVDPGTAKCGLAVVSAEGAVVYRAVVVIAELPEALAELERRFAPAQVALGDRTGAGSVEGTIRAALPQAAVALVGEDRSTEEARRLYWEYHPPRGWLRLAPRGLLLPHGPLDGYAAEILARRWLAQAEVRPGS
jgi:RNase H-fold protein (predicted Holliday junction resolvase)